MKELQRARLGMTGFKPVPSITDQRGHLLPLHLAHHARAPYAPGC